MRQSLSGCTWMSPTTTRRTLGPHVLGSRHPRPGGASALCRRLQHRQRVDRVAVHPHLEVQVRAGGVARGAHQRDGGTGFDPIALVNEQLGGVRVVVLGGAVLDDDQVAVTAHPARVGDGAGGGGHDGVTGVAVYVEARVPVGARDTQLPVTVARGDRADYWPPHGRWRRGDRREVAGNGASRCYLAARHDRQGLTGEDALAGEAVGAYYGRHGRVVIEGELPEGLARAYRDRLRLGTTQVTTADRVLARDGERGTRVQDGGERYAVGVCQPLGCRAVGARDGPQAVAADDLDRQRLELLVAGIQDQHLPRVYERAVEVVEGDDVRDAHTVGRGDVVE